MIEANKEKLEQKMCATLEEETLFTHTFLPGHIYIRIHPAQQHFWSPQLHLTFAQENEQVIVRGLYGPNPSLWAVFFFGYVAIGVLSLFIGMWGFARYSLGLDASILWIIPGLGVLALILYAASQAGQKMGAQQMFDIHHFYESFVKDKVVVS